MLRAFHQFDTDSGTGNNARAVDYTLFCDMVLDPQEVRKQLFEEKRMERLMEKQREKKIKQQQQQKAQAGPGKGRGSELEDRCLPRHGTPSDVMTSRGTDWRVQHQNTT
jgi:hypothetical protein